MVKKGQRHVDIIYAWSLIKDTIYRVTLIPNKNLRVITSSNYLIKTIIDHDATQLSEILESLLKPCFQKTIGCTLLHNERQQIHLL